MDGVLDAYFEPEIEIAVAAPGTLDTARIGAVLTEHEVAHTSIKRAGG